VWKDPATVTTRKIALKRLVAQTEELGMEQMERINVEDVLDGESDGGEQSGDGGGDVELAGNNQLHGKKRRTGSEARDTSGAKKQKSHKSSADGGVNNSIAARTVQGDMEPKRLIKSTLIRVRRGRKNCLKISQGVTTSAQQGNSTAGPNLSNRDDYTAKASLLAEADETLRVPSQIKTHPLSNDTQDVEGGPPTMETGTPKNGWTGRLGLW
jgi:hypothetical protein